MIAVDTSALVAIAFAEPERAAFKAAIRNADKALVSAVSVVEARMVVFRRRGPDALEALNDILDLPMFEVVPPDLAELSIAHQAFVTYGRGSHHPANLNFGDLFSYALAKARGAPLLFKGDDFGQTDIAVAVRLES